MTDRLKGVLVTFDKDIRDDDAECLIDAIRCIRSVASVKPLVVDHADFMARERVSREFREKLLSLADAFRP